MPLLRVLDLRGDLSDPTERLPRPRVDFDEAQAEVTEILAAVRQQGDAALRALGSRFDGVELEGLAVPSDVLESALVALDTALRAALERAVAQVRWFHERARPSDWITERGGARLGQRFRPLRRVGIYVPGGLAAYPSTVLMTTVPARVAGVEEVVLCTPPRGGDGWPDPTILAAAALLDVDRVVRVGGAQAIAAMAYGTESVPACDKIVGPGNLYVSLAKRLVQAEGQCGIDAVAGPTEVAIIADDTADPRIIAADLVAQAEHDALATCLLVTAEESLVDRVQGAVGEEVAATRHRERVTAALRGQGAVVLVDDVAHAVDVVNAFAPEHLEVQTADAAAVADRIRFAGAVFVGATTPVSLGDYAAGPNHTLPTSGTARFSGGLSTSDFLVPVNWVEYDQDALVDLAPVVRHLSAAEDLPAHARAVEIRLEGTRRGGRPEERSWSQERSWLAQDRDKSARGRAPGGAGVSPASAGPAGGEIQGKGRRPGGWADLGPRRERERPPMSSGGRALTGQRVPVRDDLRDLEPYGAPQLDVIVRLNTNETPEPPPAQFEAAVRARLAGLDLHRYPDRRVSSLRQRLALSEGLTPERTWAANGSNEVLLQLLQAYGGPGRRLLLFRPGYSMYPLLARTTLTEVVAVDLPDDFVLTSGLARGAVTTHDPDLVMLAHPNNPTGIAVSFDAVRALHDASRALVVVDEAYVEFGASTLRPLLDALPRLVITRTFSKAFRLAGLRLGYLLAHDWVVDDLCRVRLPYHLDTLKQVAAECALDLAQTMLTHIPRVVAERERVAEVLASMPDVEAYPSAANFILLRTEVPDMFQRLLDRGVLVRDFSTQPRLRGCLRVTIGTPAEDDAFLEALTDALSDSTA